MGLGHGQFLPCGGFGGWGLEAITASEYLLDVARQQKAMKRSNDAPESLNPTRARLEAHPKHGIDSRPLAFGMYLGRFDGKAA
jgi:hypothetical protein